MNGWKSFLDSLDTGGGHIFVLSVLIGFGSWLFFKDSTAGGQIITLAFGSLLTLLKVTKSNRQQLADTPLGEAPISTTTQAVVTTETKTEGVKE